MNDPSNRFDVTGMFPPAYGGKPDVRMHHYLFAHFILPGRLWRNPDGFLDSLHGPHSRGFLITRWLEAASALEDDDFLPPGEGLQYDSFEIAGGYRADLISLPEPERMTEAYMVAIVSRPARRKAIIRKIPAVLRYFTLEFGYHADMKTRRTVFCEWTPEGHLNYDTGPSPNPKAFLQAIEARLAVS